MYEWKNCLAAFTEKFGRDAPEQKNSRTILYFWPMITDYRHGTDTLLVRSPFFESGKSSTC